MVNRCKPLINVVTADKPKMLSGLLWSDQRVVDPLTQRYQTTGGEAGPTPSWY